MLLYFLFICYWFLYQSNLEVSLYCVFVINLGRLYLFVLCLVYYLGVFVGCCICAGVAVGVGGLGYLWCLSCFGDV